MKNQADSFLLLKSVLEIQIAKELCNQVNVTLAQLRYETIYHFDAILITQK